MPATLRKPASSGWSTEWGRPDIPFMLRELSREYWTGPRAAVFVCGPPGMRRDVARAVRELQRDVWSKESCREEVFLHAENYAL
jgi:NAD(P)H-flavin reductase